MDLDEDNSPSEQDSTLQVELVGGQLPTKGSDKAAGLDLHATKTSTIPPGERALVPTGIKVKLPPGTYGRVAPRSGLALKGIDVAAGVIDRDFRGEIQVVLVNNSSSSFIISVGDRIAQLIIERIATVDIIKVDTLDPTSRGDRGFGSIGLEEFTSQRSSNQERG